MIPEPILGVIPAAWTKKGLFGREMANIFVTPRGIIVAVVTNDMIRDEVQRRNDAAKAQGEGFLSRAFGSMTVAYSFYERYAGWTPAQILAERPENLGIPRESITSVRVHEGRERRDRPDQQGVFVRRDPNKVEIRWGGGSRTWEFVDTAMSAADARRLFASAFGF